MPDAETNTALATRPTHAVADVASTEQARAYEAQAEAENTTAAYKQQVRFWMEWCKSHGVQPWPAKPQDIIKWLGERAKGTDQPDIKPAAISTLSLALSAIKFVADSRGMPFDDKATWPGADGKPVSFKRVWAGIRRSKDAGRRQASALTGPLLRDVVTGLGDSTLDIRDACLMSLMYVCALRRSEVVGIDYMERGADEKTRGDVVLTLKEDRLVLTLHRSKTKQEGTDSVVVMREANPLAFAALDRWVRAAKIQPGEPLIRRLTARKTVAVERMKDSGASRAVKAAMQRFYTKRMIAEGLGKKEARIEGERMAKNFSGHSGRVGFVVSAKEAGAQDSDVMSTTRHTSQSMIAHYGREANKALRAPHKLKGVGL